MITRLRLTLLTLSGCLLTLSAHAGILEEIEVLRDKGVTQYVKDKVLNRAGETVRQDFGLDGDIAAFSGVSGTGKRLKLASTEFFVVMERTFDHAYGGFSAEQGDAAASELFRDADEKFRTDSLRQSQAIAVQLLPTEARAIYKSAKANIDKAKLLLAFPSLGKALHQRIVRYVKGCDDEWSCRTVDKFAEIATADVQVPVHDSFPVPANPGPAIDPDALAKSLNMPARPSQTHPSSLDAESISAIFDAPAQKTAAQQKKPPNVSSIKPVAPSVGRNSTPGTKKIRSAERSISIAEKATAQKNVMDGLRAAGMLERSSSSTRARPSLHADTNPRKRQDATQASARKSLDPTGLAAWMGMSRPSSSNASSAQRLEADLKSWDKEQERIRLAKEAAVRDAREAEQRRMAELRAQEHETRAQERADRAAEAEERREERREARLERDEYLASMAAQGVALPQVWHSPVAPGYVSSGDNYAAPFTFESGYQSSVQSWTPSGYTGSTNIVGREDCSTPPVLGDDAFMDENHMSKCYQEHINRMKVVREALEGSSSSYSLSSPSTPEKNDTSIMNSYNFLNPAKPVATKTTAPSTSSSSRVAK